MNIFNQEHLSEFSLFYFVYFLFYSVKYTSIVGIKWIIVEIDTFNYSLMHASFPGVIVECIGFDFDLF